MTDEEMTARGWVQLRATRPVMWERKRVLVFQGIEGYHVDRPPDDPDGNHTVSPPFPTLADAVRAAEGDKP